MVQVYDIPDPGEEEGRGSSNGGEEASEVSEELQAQGLSEAQLGLNGAGKGKKKRDKDKEREKERKPDKEKDKKLAKAATPGKGKALVPAKAAKPKVVTPSEDDMVRAECEKAVKTMKNNPQRAQKAIKETCQKHPTISLGFRYHAYIEKRLAEQQNDASKLKKQHIKTALEAAKQATVLNPNSVEHAFFYAIMLHEWVPEGEENGAAVAECERALAITEPRDPQVDMLGELADELKTPELRIHHFRQQLRQLYHQAKLSGLQHVFKHVGVDAEGNIVPFMRQLQSNNDKELEQRILQPKRANEVKKSTKTDAERRKQIEAQLEATRLLMLQKEERKAGKEAQEVVEVEEKEQRKGGEKKRGGKGKGHKNGADEKLKRVQPFWETASAEKRTELLQVPISELTQRLKSSRNAESSSLLEEALDFYKENQVWRFWICNKCNAKFKTGVEHKIHVQEKHLILPAGDDLSPIELPPNFDLDKMLPTDGKEAARLLLEDALQKRVIGPEAKQATSPRSPTSEAPFLDAHENNPDADGSDGGMSGESQFEEAGEQFEPLLKEGEEGEHFADSDNVPVEHFCPTHGAGGCPVSIGNQDVELPVVEDEKRGKALMELLSLVRVLIEHKLLFMNHQQKIFQFLVDFLQAMLPEPALNVEWQHDWNLLRLVDEEPIAQVQRYLEDDILGEGTENKLTITYNIEEDEPIALDIGLSETQEVLAPSKRLMYLLLHKMGDPFRPEEGALIADGGSDEGAKDPPAESAPGDEAKEGGAKDPLEGKDGKGLVEEKEPLLAKETPPTEGPKDGASVDGSESSEGSEKKGEAKGGEAVPKEGEQIAPAAVPPSAEDQLKWIFNIEEKAEDTVPLSWSSNRDQKKRAADDLYNELRKHHREFQKCIHEKMEIAAEDRAVQNAEQALETEIEQAKESGGSEHELPFIQILKGRLDELQKARLGLRPDKAEQKKAIDSDIEAIRMILAKANTLQIYHQRSRLNGRGLADSSEDEGEFEIMGLRESNRFKNKKVRAAMESMRQEMDARIENIDKRIMELQRVISLGYVNLQEALGFDYRLALVPIIKQHIQHKLTAAVDEDAVRKSDEARATLLSDLEKEEKKAEPLKVAKAKDAKKKDRRKSKDAKKLTSTVASERDGDEGEDSDEELAEDLKETKAEQQRPEASPDEEDEVGRRLEAVLERQRLELEALAKDKNKSLKPEQRRMIEQAEREALLREEEEERQLKHALAESERQQERDRKAKQQNGDADGGWELASSGRRGGHSHPGGAAHSHPGGAAEEKRPSSRETEQRKGEESRRPMTTGGMREGHRPRHDPSRIPVVQHPQHHQNPPRHTPPPSPPLSALPPRQVDNLALRQLEDFSKTSTWSHVAGAHGRAHPKPQNPRSLKDQQQQALTQRYAPDGGSKGGSPQWHPTPPQEGDPSSLSLGGPSGWDGAGANGSLPGVVEDESEMSDLMSVLMATPQKSDHGFAAALRTGLPAETQSNGSGREGDQERADGAIPEDDKRFQADIQLAMQQSLQASGAPPRPQYPPVRVHPSANGSATAGGDMVLQETVAGKGLVNETGQYNCFLNVVIQSLWHLRSFRERLLDRSSEAHAHVGHPCVVCALREIFTALDNRAPGPGQQGAVDPTPLRMALDAKYSETNFFQEGQMNDASEVLDAVFDAMHKAYTAPPGQEYASSDKEEAKPDGWTCTQLRRCIVHDLFGLDVAEEMQCSACKMVSRKLKYTSYFHNINASALRREKSLEPNHTLAELLNCIDHHHDLPCDPDIGGCNQVNQMQYELRATPYVFTTVLGWQTSRESIEDISATVSAIDIDIDVLTVYSGALSGLRHRLVSVVCYYGQHYHCFAYNQELARWVMFDDTNVKLIGSWDDVMRACCRGHLQPQVLFYERVAD